MHEVSFIEKLHPDKHSSGDRYGRLELVKLHSKRGYEQLWEFKCDCGRPKVAFIKNVVRGITRSCGCYSMECRMRRSTTHGCSKKLEEYAIWCSIKSRCHNPNSHAKKWYMDKGVKMCDSWRGSFTQFLSDMGCRPSKNHSIHRINPEDGYRKENCKWATVDEQNENKSSTRLVVVKGVQKPLFVACREYGLKYKKVHALLAKSGWAQDVVDSTFSNKPLETPLVKTWK